MQSKGTFGGVVMAAVDLGGDWGNVVAHAIQLSKMTGARLHLVHVVETSTDGLDLDKKERKALEKRLHAEMSSRLDQVVADAAEKVDAVTATLLTGNPTEALLGEIEAAKAGVVVVGARGVSGTARLILRTTPNRLLHSAPVPILVVGPESPRKLKRILVPVAFQKGDEGAARTAMRVADGHKARVSVLHIEAEPSVMHRHGGDLAKIRREIRAKAKSDMAAFAAGISKVGGQVPSHKLIKMSTDTIDAAEAIVAEASRLKMDLIVMCRGEHSALRHFFIGSTAEKIMRTLPCSLLSLPLAWAKKA